MKQISTENYDLVTFDVFDTLITRVFHQPSMVLSLLEHRMKEACGFYIPDFAKHRRRAEIEANADTSSETTLRDIYDRIGKRDMLTDAEIDALMALEIETEKMSIIPRLTGLKVFRQVIEAGIPVALVSDMYHSARTIRSFMQCISVERDTLTEAPLLVSSEENCAKREGHLFSVVMDRWNVLAERMLHVGDNPKTDIAPAREKGINTLHLEAATDRLKKRSTFNNIFQGSLESHPTLASSYVSKSVTEQMATIGAPEGHFMNSPENFGYCALGPLMLGFSRWLECKVNERSLEKVLFLGRDGMVMKETFDQWTGSDCCETAYVHASRQNAHLCGLVDDQAIRAELTKKVSSQSVERYLHTRFGLPKTDALKERLKCEGIRLDDRADKGVTPRTLSRVVLDLASEVKANAQERRDAYQTYLANYIGDREKVAIVDIGYSGTSQSFFEGLMGREFVGLYLYTNDVPAHSALPPERFAGYIDNLCRKQKKRGIEKHRWFYEIITCAPENSLFDIRKHQSVPYTGNARISFVTHAHRGAVDFVKHARQNLPFPRRDFWLSPEDATVILDTFLEHPSPADCLMFKDLEFEDSMGRDTRRFIISGSVEKSLWKTGHRKLTQPAKKNRREEERALCKRLFRTASGKTLLNAWRARPF